ncbi:MAG: spore coat protein [Clostridia bacterium]|nr:spore coat protein [Clostridia bacterium]
MDEKTMVNDTLSMINSSLTGYANMIAQSENVNLRQTLQQIRNNDETSQYDLFKLAEQKGFYKPAAMAPEVDVCNVKNLFVN